MADQKDASDAEDVPSDFFDDFSKEEFMEGLSVVDSWGDEGKQRSRINAEAVESVRDLRELIEGRDEDGGERRQRDRERRRSQDRSLDDYIKPGSRRDPSKTNEAIKRDKAVKVKQQLAKHLEATDDLRPPGTELDDFFDENKKIEHAKQEQSQSRRDDDKKRESPQRRRRRSAHRSPRRSPRRSPLRHRQNPRHLSPLRTRRFTLRRSVSPLRPNNWSRRGSPTRPTHNKFGRRSPRPSPVRRDRRSRSRDRRSRSRDRHSRRSRSRSVEHRDSFLYPKENPGFKSKAIFEKLFTPQDAFPDFPEPGPFPGGAPPGYPFGAPGDRFGPPGDRFGPPGDRFGPPGDHFGLPGDRFGAPGDCFGAPGGQFPAPTPYADFGPRPPVPGGLVGVSMPVPVPQPVPAPAPAMPLVPGHPMPVMSLPAAPPMMVPAPQTHLQMSPVPSNHSSKMDTSDPHDALAQLVAEGKLSQEDYLKLAPNKSKSARLYDATGSTVDTKTRVDGLKRCNGAVSKLCSLNTPNKLIMNSSLFGPEPKAIAPKFCSPLKRQATVDFHFTTPNASTAAVHNKQLIDAIVAKIGLPTVVARKKKKLPKNMKDAAVQTTKPHCDVCEIREATHSYDTGTSIDPEYFSCSAQTQVLEHELLSSRAVFTPSGGAPASNPMSIAHLTPAQLVSQLAARAKTLKQTDPQPPPNHFRRPPGNYDYEDRGRGQQYPPDNYNNYGRY